MTQVDESTRPAVPKASARHYAIRGVDSAPPPSSQLPIVMSENGSYLNRWLKVWIALLAVVTLVVVVYLIAITNSLSSINNNLATADHAVTGAGGNTKTLPDQVQGINTSLGGIDTALQPVPAQADAIIGALTSIDGKLANTDGSLQDTSASLHATSSQLGDTSAILQAVLGQAGTIRGTLAAADRPNGDCATASCAADQLGAQNIHQRVAIANDILAPAKSDTGNIIAGLDSVNGHLSSICGQTQLLRAGAGSCPR